MWQWIKSLFHASGGGARGEPERQGRADAGLGLLRYPLAEPIQGKPMRTRGTYRKGYPEGAVVHFTAGRSLRAQDAVNTVNYGADSGYCFFVIARDGTVHQNFQLDKWGYHAGASSWPGLGSGVSEYLVGIEICNAGKLDANGVSWFGEKYASGEVRERPDGKWHAYTEAQELSLVALLRWLKANKPDVFRVELVVGHEETAVPAGRKNDPGGALSCSMSELRKKLAR